MNSQYVTGPLGSALTFSSGGKSSACFSVSVGNTVECGLGGGCTDCECVVGTNGNLGVIKRNPTGPPCYYPNWWKSSTCCDTNCKAGGECDNDIDNDNQANSVNVTNIVGIVQRELNDVDDIDDETADKLIAMMKSAAHEN